MDRRSAFIAVRQNSQMSEEVGSEYECEISYPPPPSRTEELHSIPNPHPLQFQPPPPHNIHPAYWYWFNAYSQLLEQQSVADL